MSAFSYFLAIVLVAILIGILYGITRALVYPLADKGLFDRFVSTCPSVLRSSAVTAPARVLSQIGKCTQCKGPITTHAYELAIEYSNVKNPRSRQEIQYDSRLFCDRCYHRTLALIFCLRWLRRVLVCLVLLTGTACTCVALLGDMSEHTLGTIWGVLLLGLLFARWLLKKASHEAEYDVLFFVHVSHPQIKHWAFVFPWAPASLEICVPAPLAIVVRQDSELRDVSMDSLRTLLRGNVPDDEATRGDTRPKAYIPMAPYREQLVVACEVAGDLPVWGCRSLKDPHDVLSKVRADPEAVGVLSFVYVLADPTGIRALTVDGQTCSAENSAYPLWLLPGLFSRLHEDADRREHWELQERLPDAVPTSASTYSGSFAARHDATEPVERPSVSAPVKAKPLGRVSCSSCRQTFIGSLKADGACPLCGAQGAKFAES
jgi:hypothetical protein